MSKSTIQSSDDLSIVCAKFEKSDLSQPNQRLYSLLPSLVSLIVWSLPRDTWVKKYSQNECQVSIVELASSLTDADLCLCRERARHVQRLGYKKKNPPGSYTSSDNQQEVMQLDLTAYDILESYGVIPLPNLHSYLVKTEMDLITILRVAGPKTVNLDFSSLGYKPAYLPSGAQHPTVVPLPNSLRAVGFRDSSLPKEVTASFVHSLQDVQPPLLHSLLHPWRLPFRHLQRIHTGTRDESLAQGEHKCTKTFDREFYLIMNVAVGGTNGWFTDGEGDKPWLKQAANPMRDFADAIAKWYPTWPKKPEERGMVVDYVKMWKRCKD